MFLKEIKLTNFKSHTNSHYHFGKTNHFFGDNYTGKSSVGEAIVFCLFGMTKHGYKGYVKDYLQEGKTTAKVEMTLLLNDKEYIISRTMNPKGTTTVFLNDDPTNDKKMKKLLGDYQRFIYSFFPEVFPDEDKNTARAFLVDILIPEKNALEESEKEKRRVLKEQKNVESSRTFYEGQKTLLLKQVEVLPKKQIETSIPPSDIMARKQRLQDELDSIQVQLEQQLKEGYQLQAQLKSLEEKLIEIEKSEQSTSEHCPTCNQTLPIDQLETICATFEEKKKDIGMEIEFLTIKLTEDRKNYSELANKKKFSQKELHELTERYPSPANNDQSIQALKELEIVEIKLKELWEKKMALTEESKQLKHRMGLLTNQYQNQINLHLTDTRIDLFKQLKNGELRPDFQITFKNRPYRVLSNSEKVRCMLEIIRLININQKENYPIFLDNLESITHLNPPDAQIITASVKKGMPLTLKVV